MARPIYKNGILVGISGRLGDVVYRQYNGRTLTCKPPSPRKTGLSPAQRKINEKFKAASIYTKEVMADPKRRKAYWKLQFSFPTLRNAIMSDYMKNGPLPDGYRLSASGTRVKNRSWTAET